MPVEIGDVNVSVDRVMRFHSDAVDDDVLEVASIEAKECISKPYEFHLELASRDKDLDLANLVESKAWLSIKQGLTEAGSGDRASTTVKVHGVLSDIEHAGRMREWVRYRAVLRPRLWKLSLSHNSRIFQELTIPDLVKEICDAYEVKVDLDKLSADHKVREYIVQYEESDLDFIHRWMEHEGIYYYFTQSDDEEVMVLGDAAEAYGTLVGDTEFIFTPTDSESDDAASRSGGLFTGDWFGTESVSALTCTHKQLPKEVVLNDYNWRTPQDKLEATATVSDKGIGTVYEYNNHYTDADEGKTLAEIRAEEINCREMEFRGRSDARGFRAGATFTLKVPLSNDEKERNGLKDSFYQEYLLVEVQHAARQSLEIDGADVSGATYSNTFLCIPKSKVFRPPSATPWPSIKGVMHAVVDGEDGGTPYAQIDDKGRYKVRFPLDRGDSGDGNASRWVRKSEAYAGPNQGMHFPLLKGAEVLITHIDGDPDRPIISGAVFNEQNTSVVHQHNHTTNQIVTPIGNTLTIDDTQGAPQIIMYTENELNKIVFDGTSGSEKITIKCSVSNSYIRFGKGNSESTPEKVTNADGIYITADGDINIVSGGNTKMNAAGLFEQYVGGDANIHIVGKKDEKVDGNSDWTIKGNSAEYKTGDWFTFNAAAKVETGIGACASVQVGAKAELAYALSASVTRGDGFEATFGHKLKIDKSSSRDLIKDDKLWACAKKVETQAAGDITLTSMLGKVEVDGQSEVTLKCGMSSITLKPSGIVLKVGDSKVELGMGKALMQSNSATKVECGPADVTVKPMVKEG